MSCAVLLYLYISVQILKKKYTCLDTCWNLFHSLAKSRISVYNLQALCERNSWLKHVPNDRAIDLLSCKFYPWPFSNVLISILLWLIEQWFFYKQLKLNCHKSYVFSNAICSCPMKTMQVLNFSHSSAFFYRLATERKNCFEHRTMKNEGKVVWNLSEILKTFMTHAKQRRVAYLFSSGRLLLPNSSQTTRQIKSTLAQLWLCFLKLNLANDLGDGCSSRSQAFFFHVRTESTRDSCSKLK